MPPPGTSLSTCALPVGACTGWHTALLCAYGRGATASRWLAHRRGRPELLRCSHWALHAEQLMGLRLLSWPQPRTCRFPESSEASSGHSFLASWKLCWLSQAHENPAFFHCQAELLVSWAGCSLLRRPWPEGASTVSTPAPRHGGGAQLCLPQLGRVLGLQPLPAVSSPSCRFTLQQWPRAQEHGGGL